MKNSTIRFSTFPRTEPPPGFVEDLVNAFRQHESEIATEINDKGLRSNDVLAVRSTVKKLSVLLSLLGLLLFLATPALGDTRGGVVDSKGGPVDIHFSHVEPNEKLVVLSFVEVEGKTWAIAEHVPRYTNSLLVRLPHDAVNYDKQRVTNPVNAPDVGSIWKTHG